MSLLSLFAFTVFAAETIISPLPDNLSTTPEFITKPDISFGAIISPIPDTNVLGETTTVLPTPTPTPTPTPQAPVYVAKKSHYTIAVLGDSMVDTLGPGVPALAGLLKNSYPGVTFTILNYGVGATNISYGLERLTHDYDYLGNHIPSLVSQHPDIVVVESFGYNPYSFDQGALDKQWLTLAAIIDVIRGQLPGTKIIIAATIAPNANVFGDGAAGLSFGPVDKQERVTVIKRYIENAIRFAQGEHLPLADAYHPSLTSDGNGNLAYINGGDHIHYSGSGRALFAQAVFGAITGNRLLE